MLTAAVAVGVLLVAFALYWATAPRSAHKRKGVVCEYKEPHVCGLHSRVMRMVPADGLEPMLNMPGPPETFLLGNILDFVKVLHAGCKKCGRCSSCQPAICTALLLLCRL